MILEQVHQRHIGPEFLSHPQSGSSVCYFPGDLESGAQLQKAVQPFAHDCMVVGDGNTNRHTHLRKAR
jgi:hypothetical protein